MDRLNTKTHYKQYTNSDINNAITQINFYKMTVHQASSIFKIPLRTLYSKINKNKHLEPLVIIKEEPKILFY